VIENVYAIFYGCTRTDRRYGTNTNEYTVTPRSLHTNAPARTHLRTLSTDTTSKLNILGHNSNPLRMNRTQIGILKKTNKVRLSSLLKGQNRRSLETKIGLEVLGDLTHKTLEGQLADEEVGRLLVTTDLTEGDGTGAVTVGLLYSSGCGGRLTSGLGGELFTGGFSSGGFTGGLFGTGHLDS